MDILLGLWPNVEGSGVVGIRKIVRAPTMIPPEKGMLMVTELDEEVLVESKLPGNPPAIDGELRCTTSPEHIETLYHRDPGWERVTEKTCTYCPRQ